ncbi:hypothetical protein ACH4TQ_27360 [Streptomyces sp. NPDC021218]|uniref:hypothetical protein n=1 Tax=Streptomyces sp. NPDC021218 TaxID=3365119 RepID=UPI00379BC1A8
MRRDRDTFSDGGYWQRPSPKARPRTRGEAADLVSYDHQPRRRGLIARLLTPRGNRP